MRQPSHPEGQPHHDRKPQTLEQLEELLLSQTERLPLKEAAKKIAPILRRQKDMELVLTDMGIEPSDAERMSQKNTPKFFQELGNEWLQKRKLERKQKEKGKK